jgi:branched-chain amino acid transport system substrate-binding protein
MRKLTFLFAAALLASAAQAQPSGDTVKIAVLADMSGPYASLAGKGSVIAAQMAIKDFGGKVLGKPIELVTADHQNKADIGSAIARRWLNQENVDAIFDVPNSAVAFAVLDVAKAANKIVAYSGPVSASLTGPRCAANSFHWTYDTNAIANTTGRALNQKGADTWFFVSLDSATGQLLEGDLTKVIASQGGKIIGQVRHPLNTSDFSAFMLTAQQSKAKVIALANAGADTVNAIKQAAEYRISDSGAKVAALLLMINDIHALGLPVAKGVVTAESFYWDLNDETRAWNRRFMAEYGGAANMVQAGTYSAVLHYLKAVAAAGTDETNAVANKMREIPVNDFYTKNVKVREDGRVMRDMYLFEVKSPAESRGAWDYYKLIDRVSGEQAYKSLAEGGCPLVRK